MKKIIAFISAVAIVASLAIPASAAVGGFDISKAQPSINKAVTEIISKPSFSWNSWLNQILSRYK